MSEQTTKVTEHGLEPARKVSPYPTLRSIFELLASGDFDIVTSAGKEIGNAVLIENKIEKKAYYILEADTEEVSEFKICNTGVSLGFSIIRKNPSIKPAEPVAETNMDEAVQSLVTQFKLAANNRMTFRFKARSYYENVKPRLQVLLEQGLLVEVDRNKEEVTFQYLNHE